MIWGNFIFDLNRICDVLLLYRCNAHYDLFLLRRVVPLKTADSACAHKHQGDAEADAQYGVTLGPGMGYVYASVYTCVFVYAPVTYDTWHRGQH